MSAYKNLEIYQSAFNLAIKVYRMNIMLPVNALLNQGNRLRWASLLIKDLIAEAYTGIKSEKEVVRNLTLAETSTEEVIKLLKKIRAKKISPLFYLRITYLRRSRLAKSCSFKKSFTPEITDLAK